MARRLRRVAAVCRIARFLLAALLLVTPPTSASSARTIVAVGANESLNWAGYTQGTLEKGITFHSISGEWIVPKAKQHKKGEPEYSSSWIGIGGSCLDAACTLFDPTLIQAGIEHDVDANGTPSFYAWWEAIPAPLIRVDLAVSAGDHVRVVISEDGQVPELWTITISNLSTAAVFSLTAPYASTYGTAEWVIETPVVITDDGGVQIGPMPDLAPVRFDNATVNGQPAGLIDAERMLMVDSDLSVIAAPSAPDSDRDGFNDCAYRGICPAPSKELR
ncbi:MAG: hypothetical protein E6J24_05620 [Chloroflexi bacterium]|nr:MAG: hypothetical protein E6J24_05620 [Chloroflexota bacterium]